MKVLLVLISLIVPSITTSVIAEEIEHKKPNIVFILADDHRWDYLSVMDHPFIETPSIDSIANEGVLFENAFVTSSLCSPSRASFLTGQYPQQHGVQNNFTVWDNKNITYFEPLKAAGYATAFIGKWHMPGGLPKLRGVDQFISFEHHGGQGAYYGTPYIVNGKKLKLNESPVEGVEISGYITDDLTNFANKYIEDNKDRPFALYLSHKALHLPMTPDAEAAGRYDDVEITLPREADSWLAFADGNFKHFLWDPLEEKMKDYAETAVAMDQQIGLVLAKLDELGLSGNTIVVFAGDNGYMWGEHRLIDKRWSYEESMRIPFIIKYPNGIKNPGRRSQEMLLNLDMAPTFLALAGLEVPEQMQGKSAVAVLEDKPDSLRDAWLYKYYEDYPYPVPEQLALRTKRYKLIDYKRGKKDELFDLKNDPLEQTNLIDDPSMQTIYQELKERLIEMEAEVSQPTVKVE
ncbi:sulfatase family protein [Thalassotalea hakodatensis]|uniref:sulfatase family protein n=1 Tax=Thalassotalea hakodatensis TaxID=3030492 RepID=UPI0025722B99|nr:sulfatase [Thalassotalea hakodatensis]